MRHRMRRMSQHGGCKTVDGAGATAGRRADNHDAGE